MVDQASIAILEARIGFGLDEIAVPVAPSHRVGTSGRTLPSFHKLANLTNIYSTVEEIGMNEATLNAFLAQLKKDTVAMVLMGIFHRNPDYLKNTDYSYVVEKYPTLFDDAIGYSLAVAAIELSVTTNRNNDKERNARLTYDKLKIELEGIRDSYGNIMSSGLKRAQYVAIKDVAHILFPHVFIIESPKVW